MQRLLPFKCYLLLACIQLNFLLYISYFNLGQRFDRPEWAIKQDYGNLVVQRDIMFNEKMMNHFCKFT